MEVPLIINIAKYEVDRRFMPNASHGDGRGAKENSWYSQGPKLDA